MEHTQNGNAVQLTSINKRTSNAFYEGRITQLDFLHDIMIERETQHFRPTLLSPHFDQSVCSFVYAIVK